MIRIRPAGIADIPFLQELWSLNFGDGFAFLDLFFDTLFPFSDVFAVEEDGSLVGSAYLLNTLEFVDADGSARPCPYIYAVSVRPEYRNLGLGRQLTLACREKAESQGQLSCLVPAEPSLFAYYERCGYHSAFAVHEEACDAGEAVSANVTRLSVGEYNRRREEFLQGIPHLRFRDEALQFYEAYCRSTEGGFFEIRFKDTCAIAACEAADSSGELAIKELLCSDDRDNDCAATLCASLEFPSGHYCRPVKTRQSEPHKAFGMLSESLSCGPCYFGPGFD